MNGVKIEKIAKELCEKSGCHHKCHDTKDCVVEDEALLLINESKSNNFDVKSNEELFKQALVEGLNRHFDKIIEKEKQIEKMAQDVCGYCDYGVCILDGKKCDLNCSHRDVAEKFYNAGYRKQSEGEWIEGVNPFIEDTIYPLTIIADRYRGTYSGGSFLAWNLEADAIPEGAQGYDGYDALDFWENNKTPCGKGRTVSEAVLDLYLKMKGGAE